VNDVSVSGYRGSSLSFFFTQESIVHAIFDSVLAFYGSGAFIANNAIFQSIF
jgi:uncharacterized membrane protein